LVYPGKVSFRIAGQMTADADYFQPGNRMRVRKITE